MNIATVYDYLQLGTFIKIAAIFLIEKCKNIFALKTMVWSEKALFIKKWRSYKTHLTFRNGSGSIRNTHPVRNPLAKILISLFLFYALRKNQITLVSYIPLL